MIAKANVLRPIGVILSGVRCTVTKASAATLVTLIIGSSTRGLSHEREPRLLGAADVVAVGHVIKARTNPTPRSRGRAH